MVLECHKGCSAGGSTERARAEQGVVRGPCSRGTIMAGGGGRGGNGTGAESDTNWEG